MADHFFSMNRGKSGTSNSDITTGASSTAADDIELRVADAANLTRKDVDLALKAFQRFFRGKSNTDFPKI